MTPTRHRFTPRSRGHILILLWGLGAVGLWFLRHHPVSLLIGFVLLSFSALGFVLRPTLTGTVLRMGQPRIDLAHVAGVRLAGSQRVVSLRISDPSLVRPFAVPLVTNGKMVYRASDNAALTAALRTSGASTAVADEIDALERMTPVQRREFGASLPALRPQS